MVNFRPAETVPDEFADRNFYHHNANVTLMRTTVEENEGSAKKSAQGAPRRGPTAIMLPREGVSAIDRDGQPFDDPAARAGTVSTAIRRNRRQAKLDRA